MLEKLTALRDAIKARHLVLESVAGSGWHRKDAGSPSMRDEMPLSERPVAFLGDDEVALVGACAPQCLEALARFAGGGPGDQRDEQQARGLDAARRLLAAGLTPAGALLIPRARWNDANWALQKAGVLCCLTHEGG